MNQECDDFLAKIAVQKRETDEQQKAVAATTILIREEETECLKIKDSAEADLQEAMPALEEAMQVKSLFLYQSVITMGIALLWIWIYLHCGSAKR